MESIQQLLSFILHIDKHLIMFVSTFGSWTYVLLFLIIFCETGLVVTPFLPGDSLLFAAGTIAASSAGAINIHLLFLLLVVASISGNGVNYAIGKFLGPKVLFSNDSWFFNKKYLTKAHNFYDRYGGKTIIIARFMPIIRTFAPFIAGVAHMNYQRFYYYNIAGAVLWIGSLLYLSYWFGNLPFIKENISFFIIGIIVISLLLPLIGALRHKAAKQST